MDLHVFVNEHDYIVDCQTGEIYSPDDIENFRSCGLDVICYTSFDQFLMYGDSDFVGYLVDNDF